MVIRKQYKFCRKEIVKMKEYDITLQLNAEHSKENIENIIIKALYMGFLCKNTQKYLSLTEALEHIREKEYIVFKLDQVPFELTTPYMNLGVLEHSRKWGKHFKRDLFIPDNIRAIGVLLDLTDSFIIKGLRLTSYLRLLEWPTEKNAIVVNCTLNSYYKEWEQSDGNDLIYQALKYGYIFIENPEDHSEVEITITANVIDTALNLKSDLDLYLKIEKFVELKEEHHVVKITITYERLILTAQEPFKMKTAQGQTSIDRAFYVRILLNLLEDMGFDELFCTL
jgi:hypothetical protein